ncbi:MAG TPA: sigma factor-like helix-turn-helix DNA-binding protein, partial [Bacteroidales bacterium]|nr:sigma factor-like helix-turn-helix DNA-binding protein [Bacteroidales bacterium]
ERWREVFEMSRFEGKKNKEISDYFDISIKAVEANITRALSILRKKVGEYMQTEKPLVVLLIISICI